MFYRFFFCTAFAFTVDIGLNDSDLCVIERSSLLAFVSEFHIVSCYVVVAHQEAQVRNKVFYSSMIRFATCLRIIAPMSALISVT